jgi:hypothetical protein
MRLSRAFVPTLKEDPADAELVSHKLMIRAGLLRKLAAGIYTLLPLGWRVTRKVEQIVREEMDRAGCQEVRLPVLMPAELWQETGRWEKYGKELFRLTDRHDREYALGPTHEEAITDLVRTHVRSDRDMPMNLYQIQTKFRDEIRPRFGVMRAREFIMKDAYSFDVSDAAAQLSYQKMYDAYTRIFARCGLKTFPVEADTGVIGGSHSHEFMVPAETGENEVAFCEACGYAANIEKATSGIPKTAAREIGAAMGKALGSPTVTNVWIPDGMKDTPADRRGPRDRLRESLDEVFKKHLNPKHNLDAVEGKLFGIGAESYTVGMHEFYLGYAVKNQMLVCLDAGHYHPTENMADKISSVLCFVPEILLHVSRGVRWDSDHVVTLTDELMAIAQELVRGNYLQRTHIGLDYFDASINRVAAWVIGARNMVRALCLAMVDPYEQYKKLEREGDYTSRLALMEEAKTLPFGAVWDYYCESQGVPVGDGWLAEVKTYERDVLSKR